MRYLLLFLLPFSLEAEIIAPSNRVDWVPYVTVGPQGGIISRGNISNVTLHGVRNDGVTNCSVAVATIWNNLQTNDVMYFPNGIYCFSNAPTWDIGGRSIRGESTNAILLNLSGTHFQIGHDPVAINQCDIMWASNCFKGDTNILLYANTNLSQTVIAAGDSFIISGKYSPNEHWQVFAPSGYTNSEYDLVRESIVVHSVSGNTISITAPLKFDYTNSARLRGTGYMDVRSQFNMRRHFGLENLTITCTNSDGRFSSPDFLCKFTMMRDSWITNCNFYYCVNRNLAFNFNVNCALLASDVGEMLTPIVAANHAGLLAEDCTGALIENCIFRNQFPVIEWNSGFTGNAIAFNYFPSNAAFLGPDCHGPNPMMNLWEGNVGPDVAWKLDGYFGGTSHQVVFRNAFYYMDTKRWSTHIQFVGNVIGRDWAPTNNYADLFQTNFTPNIGNGNYYSNSPPVAWNNPGRWTAGPGGDFEYDAFILTNNHVNTTIIKGNFTNYLVASNSFILQARATVTFSGLPSANETIEVNGTTYTWKASVGTTANEVKIGINGADSGTNLNAAINHGSGSGTLYGSDTVEHTTVDSSVSSSIVTLVAHDLGAAGDSYTLTENSANITLSTGGFEGGDDYDFPVNFTTHPLVFQVATNDYRCFGSAYIPISISNATDSATLSGPYIVSLTMTNITLNIPVTVNSGWAVWISGQPSYQQRQLGNYTNNVYHGNLLYTNSGGTLVWDPNNADHTLQTSLLYPSGMPGWWYGPTPTVDPERAGTKVGTNDAQRRYLGLAIGGGGGNQGNRIGKGRGFKQRP